MEIAVSLNWNHLIAHFLLQLWLIFLELVSLDANRGSNMGLTQET